MQSKLKEYFDKNIKEKKKELKFIEEVEEMYKFIPVEQNRLTIKKKSTKNSQEQNSDKFQSIMDYEDSQTDEATLEKIYERQTFEDVYKKKLLIKFQRTSHLSF